jgi:hypothetical protein
MSPLDDLRTIGTPSAGAALARLTLSGDDFVARQAAWRLCSLLPDRDIQSECERLLVAPPEDDRDQGFDWIVQGVVWSPLARRILCRAARLIAETSPGHLQRCPPVSPVFAAPLAASQEPRLRRLHKASVSSDLLARANEVIGRTIFMEDGFGGFTASLTPSAVPQQPGHLFRRELDNIVARPASRGRTRGELLSALFSELGAHPNHEGDLAGTLLAFRDEYLSALNPGPLAGRLLTSMPLDASLVFLHGLAADTGQSLEEQWRSELTFAPFSSRRVTRMIGFIGLCAISLIAAYGAAQHVGDGGASEVAAITALASLAIGISACAVATFARHRARVRNINVVFAPVVLAYLVVLIFSRRKGSTRRLIRLLPTVAFGPSLAIYASLIIAARSAPLWTAGFWTLVFAVVFVASAVAGISVTATAWSDFRMFASQRTGEELDPERSADELISLLRALNEVTGRGIPVQAPA